ncbi:MAG TPA: gluconate 2-dehydrogenase subunit 3 family protein [Terriglobia bacterium]|nr:gluconate 2-dehydrogenase subunit 3 family protein [Terriglobia bacterium]
MSKSKITAKRPATGNSQFTIQNSQYSQFRILTRRQWLLKLGEAAVLLGFTGTAPASETTASPLAGLAGEESAKALPPGLYEPSSDHLAHVLASDSLFHAVPPGSETDYVRPRVGAYQPQFFSSSEMQAIRRLVSLMLGEADDGSVAASAGDDHENAVAVVAEWIDLRVASAAGVREAARGLSPEHRALAVAYHGSAAAVEELETAQPERICREGLQWLTEESTRRHGKPFLDLPDEQQTVVLRKISDARPPNAAESAGTRFFKFIKHEIIRGFYTSRAGLKEIDYQGNAFHAESPGCGHDHPNTSQGGSPSTGSD